jgi:hypothetical protein
MRDAFKDLNDMAAFMPGFLFAALFIKSLEVIYGWETWFVSLRKDDV